MRLGEGRPVPGKSTDKHSLTFLFKNFGGIDGVNFHTHCAPAIQFAFQSDGTPRKPSHIVIGKHNRHPRNNPVHHHPVTKPTRVTTPQDRGMSRTCADPVRGSSSVL